MTADGSRSDPGDGLLDELMRSARVWRARDGLSGTADGFLPTGWPRLDRLLPGGGWPAKALTEILSGESGTGELRLVMPALARLGARSDGWIVWVAPPYVPYAPALNQWGLDVSKVLVVHPPRRGRGLADGPGQGLSERVGDEFGDRLDGRPGAGDDAALWAMEQALVSSTCLAALAWVDEMDERATRRLQLAAAQGGSWAVVFRSPAARIRSSAAALRLALEPDRRGRISLRLVKVRGGRPAVLEDFEGGGQLLPPAARDAALAREPR